MKNQKVRTTVSIHRGLMDEAAAMMKADSYTNFSAWLEQLIRDRSAVAKLRHIAKDS